MTCLLHRTSQPSCQKIRHLLRLNLLRVLCSGLLLFAVQADAGDQCAAALTAQPHIQGVKSMIDQTLEELAQLRIQIDSLPHHSLFARRLSTDYMKKLAQAHDAGVTVAEIASILERSKFRTQADSERQRSREEAAREADRALLDWTIAFQFGSEDGNFKAATFSPDGKYFESLDARGKSVVFETASGRPLATMLDQPKLTRNTSFSPDAVRILMMSDDTIKIWKVGSEHADGELPNQLDIGKIKSAEFYPGGTQVALSVDRTIYRWDIVGNTVEKLIESPDSIITKFSISEDGNLLAVGYLNNDIEVRSAKTGQLVRQLKNISQNGSGFSFSPDSQLLLTYSQSHPAKIWNLKTGLEIANLKVKNKIPYSAVFSPDGRRVAASYGTMVRIWDSVTGELLRELNEQTFFGYRLRFSPDGKRLVTGATKSSTLVFWNVETGNLEKVLARGGRFGSKGNSVQS